METYKPYIERLLFEIGVIVKGYFLTLVAVYVFKSQHWINIKETTMDQTIDAPFLAAAVLWAALYAVHIFFDSLGIDSLWLWIIGFGSVGYVVMTMVHDILPWFLYTADEDNQWYVGLMLGAIATAASYRRETKKDGKTKEEPESLLDKI